MQGGLYVVNALKKKGSWWEGRSHLVLVAESTRVTSVTFLQGGSREPEAGAAADGCPATRCLRSGFGTLLFTPRCWDEGSWHQHPLAALARCSAGFGPVGECSVAAGDFVPLAVQPAARWYLFGT